MKNFAVALFILFMMIAATIPTVVPVYKENVTAKRWFTVQDVHVEDTVVGKTPVMKVDRTIHKPFHAEWIAEVHKQNPDGSFAFFCKGDGENDYNTSDRLPTGNKLNLDWWTWPTQCRLPEGKYTVDTLWVLKLPNYPDKQVRAKSNVFEVRPNDD